MMCPVLGDSVRCDECNTPLCYDVHPPTLTRRLVCPKCGRRTIRLTREPPHYRCRNCGEHPHAHQGGKCLFGPSQYVPMYPLILFGPA